MNFLFGDKKKTANRAAAKGITNGDNPELYQYYYHSDHLGSSSYITNLDGDVAQHIEYVPFGEVFINEQNNKWNTPYLFNGKELDEETGLYYYGARYYNPRESVWLSVDPLAEQTLDPYGYCYQNPINMVDPTGMKGEGVEGDFYDSKGNYLGSDGFNDGKVYIVKGTEESIETCAPMNTITQEKQSETISFIKDNSNNPAAFNRTDIAYKNSVEIEGKRSTRQKMIDIISQDNGEGGAVKANNREYGGTIEYDGTVIESKKGKSSHVDLLFDTGRTKATFHSHPSGDEPFEGLKVYTFYGPSHDGSNGETGNGIGRGDIGSHMPNGTGYVFDRGTGDVIIYNTHNGVQAIMNQNTFLNLNKK